MAEPGILGIGNTPRLEQIVIVNTTTSFDGEAALDTGLWSSAVGSCKASGTNKSWVLDLRDISPVPTASLRGPTLIRYYFERMQ